MSTLKIATLNIRSYMKNRTFIEMLILKKEYDVLVLTETWL